MSHKRIYYEGVFFVLKRSRADVWRRLYQLRMRGYRIGDLIAWATHLCPEPTGDDIEFRAKCV